MGQIDEHTSSTLFWPCQQQFGSLVVAVTEFYMPAVDVRDWLGNEHGIMGGRGWGDDGEGENCPISAKTAMWEDGVLSLTVLVAAAEGLKGGKMFPDIQPGQLIVAGMLLNGGGVDLHLDFPHLSLDAQRGGHQCCGSAPALLQVPSLQTS